MEKYSARAARGSVTGGCAGRVEDDGGRGGIVLGRMGDGDDGGGRSVERCWRSSGREGGESFILSWDAGMYWVGSRKGIRLL